MFNWYKFKTRGGNKELILESRVASYLSLDYC